MAKVPKHPHVAAHRARAEHRAAHLEGRRLDNIPRTSSLAVTRNPSFQRIIPAIAGVNAGVDRAFYVVPFAQTFTASSQIFSVYQTVDPDGDFVAHGFSVAIFNTTANGSTNVPSGRYVFEVKDIASDRTLMSFRYSANYYQQYDRFQYVDVAYTAGVRQIPPARYVGFSEPYTFLRNTTITVRMTSGAVTTANDRVYLSLIGWKEYSQ